jgi:uncharacterized CHY-type Zn-finger protein
VQSPGIQQNNVKRHSAAMEGAIPENDGMQSLRQQLLQIKELALSTEEKAKRMHELMTRDYLSHIATFKPHSPSASPPETPLEPERSSLAPPVDPENPYNIRPGDLELIYSPLPADPSDGHGGVEEEDSLPDLGCMHYKRNVKVQCFDCRQWYACRHCHDAAHDLPFVHNLNRKKTQNMLCMLCQTPQPAGETCMKCGEYAAWYYCDKCKLWDNDSNKRIYHCDDCGLCRLEKAWAKILYTVDGATFAFPSRLQPRILVLRELRTRIARFACRTSSSRQHLWLVCHAATTCTALAIRISWL